MLISFRRTFNVITGIVVLVLLGAGFLFLNTQKGLDLAARFARQFLPGSLSLDELSGRLLGPIQIKNLHYASAHVKLSVSSAQLDWRWDQLLRGRFYVSSLFLDRLSLAIDGKNSTNKVQTAWWLKHICFHSMDIKQLIVRYAGNVWTLSGSLHEQWQFSWRLVIPQIHKFIGLWAPNYGKYNIISHQQIILTGTITGDKPHPTFYSLLSDTDLLWKDWQIKRLQCSCHFDTTNKKQLFIDLRAASLRYNTWSANPIHLELTGNLQPLELQGTLSKFTLNHPTKERSPYHLLMPGNEIRMMLGADGLSATLVTQPMNQIRLNAALQLSPYFVPSRVASLERKHKATIKAKIQLSLPDLRYLDGFISTFRNLKGSLNTQLVFSGPILSPSIRILLNLEQASVEIPALGIHVRNINFGFRTDGNRLHGVGQLASGKGLLKFQSQTQLDHLNLFSHINVQGNDLEIAKTKEYKITASPNLQIQADTHHLSTTGFIFFPKAVISIDDMNAGLDTLSGDIVFLDQQKPAITPVLPFVYNNTITLKIGRDVRFSYFGLSGKATGLLNVIQTNDSSTLATGELILTEGEYMYYGQRLSLKPHSSLNFANSPINNPNLDVYTQRTVQILSVADKPAHASDSRIGSSDFISSTLRTNQPQQAIVGIHLQGYLQNPHITLYVKPTNALDSQLDILSYILTGLPSNQFSASTLQLLLGVVNQLDRKQGRFMSLLSDAQKKIGIDSLRIGANPVFNSKTNNFDQNTSVIIGKNLSPRLEVSYSLGLLNPISVLQINYLLNDYFSLTSTSSNFSNGIDLIYKMEKA